MGQPADGVIQIEFTSEKFANEGKLQAEKFEEYLKEKLEDKDFSTNKSLIIVIYLHLVTV